MKSQNQVIFWTGDTLKSSFLSYRCTCSGTTGFPSSKNFINHQIRSIKSHHQILKKEKIQCLDIASLNSTIIELAKSGDLSSARQVFDRMPQRDSISWNSMMSAYVHNSQPDRVLLLFLEMQSNNLKLNSTSFSIALSSCANLSALNRGRQIHGLSIKGSFNANVFVGTSLITMYSKCNVFDCLVRVFDGINQPNLASWNALISGLVANRRVDDARRTFDQMPTHNVISWTALLSGYVEINKIRHAHELFNLMPDKNSVSWTVMLSGFVKDRQFKKAIVFFSEMRNSGVQTNIASIVSVLSACTDSESLEQGRKIHGHVIKVGYDFDEVLEASLVFMYVKCLNIEEARLEFDKMDSKFVGSWNSLICGYIDSGQIDIARRLFEQMNERDQVSWNVMINGYLSSNRINEATELFIKMPEPTVQARTALMSGFIENGRLHDAEQLFNEIPQTQRDVMAYTTLISHYMKVGLLANAWELFMEMPNRNVVTYNVMISGLVQHGKVAEAYFLFNEAPEHDSISWNTVIWGYVQNGFIDDAFCLHRQMILSDVNPSKSVITSLLSACANFSMLSHGEQIHVSAVKFGFEACLMIANSLINMYSKCGEMSKARLLFDYTSERDLVTWNSIICGYAVNGCIVEATEMFKNMKMMGIEPDQVTFLGMLSACTHGGLMEESWHYFNSMNDHGITPTVSHYACMIDLLCRMSLVEKAEELVCLMPFEPDSAIWTSLLSGCKMNCNVEIAERAANKLFALNARDPMPYLQLVRIYGSAGRWIDMEMLRTKMNGLGLKKRPGCSWIEINGEITTFFAGDRSHLLDSEVQNHLQKIMSEIKKLGYIPDYSLVIEDMEDQEKEAALIQHSEKLAIAFGLLKTASHKPLRIIKNLRVCSDCHSAFKLISLSSKREIVMRDAVRFHHFKGGSCSCSDYW